MRAYDRWLMAQVVEIEAKRIREEKAKAKRIHFLKNSFVVKKGWFVFEDGGMERVVVRQTTLEAFA